MSSAFRRASTRFAILDRFAFNKELFDATTQARYLVGARWDGDRVIRALIAHRPGSAGFGTSSLNELWHASIGRQLVAGYHAIHGKKDGAL